MRIVIINHCHPEEPHVCGRRGWAFANALLARGHQVIVLTEALGSHPVGTLAGRTEEKIEQHDWTTPLLLPVKPFKAPVLARARLGKLPGVVNKIVSAYATGLRQSPFYDWTDAAQPILREIRWSFQPELVWGIFGNAGCWVLARDLARQSGCPWVGDAKDGWMTFTPALLYGLQIKRQESAMAFTALSRDYARQVKQCFHRDPTIIYSGIDDALDLTPVPASDLSITMAGSLYGDVNLALLSEGVQKWAGELPSEDKGRFRVRYFGGEGERFARAFSWCDALEVKGYVPLEELLDVQRTSWVNVFTKAPNIYHHKLIEMLAAGRPILAVPHLDEEDLLVADKIGGRIEVGADADEIGEKLEGFRAQMGVPKHHSMQPFLWSSLAEELERVFIKARTL